MAAISFRLTVRWCSPARLLGPHTPGTLGTTPSTLGANPDTLGTTPSAVGTPPEYPSEHEAHGRTMQVGTRRSAMDP